MRKNTSSSNSGGSSRSLFFLLLMTVLLLPGFKIEASSRGKTLDWLRVVRLKPELKVMVLIESDRALSLDDLTTLGELGLASGDRDPALFLGLRQAIFSTSLRNWINRRSLPDHMKGKLLDRFIMSGIYRTEFRIEKEGYWGPLVLEVTTPRDGFGKRLLYSENIIRPKVSTETYTDSGENRWLRASYPEVKHGQTIKLAFAFRYLVNMLALLDHDLMLVDQFQDAPIPEEIRPFLNSGYKIDAGSPHAVDWATQEKSVPLNVRSDYRRLTNFLKDTVVYDRKKRDRYFGGKAIYSDLDDMYQDIEVTLSNRLGACPDTTLLECAFLRARGIPCRTAGRFRHFFSIVYVPGKGWMSTSITPTGIPLFVAPGPDHVPYQKWRPGIPLRTVRLEASIRIEPAED